MNINQSSGQGALFELVARGIKDTYFMKDNVSSDYSYSGQYDSSAPHLAERKTIVPLNAPRFGGTFEVELEPYADILSECALEIDLPSWIPSLPLINGGANVSPERVNSLNWITDLSGYSYGYVNYIGYLLFERIQFYQGQVLIQEWSGDGLLCDALLSGSWNSSYLAQRIGGNIGLSNDGRSIALRATPGHLRIKLPLPGIQEVGDGGFPFICAQSQNYRFRITLRRLEDLVVSNNGAVKPSPWNLSAMKYYFENDNNGQENIFSPLGLIDIGQPNILLSTIQHYVAPELSSKLKESHVVIPFRRMFDNVFTFGELDYKPIDNGGTAAVTRRLDGRHPTESVLFFFRAQNSIDKNKLDDFTNSVGIDGQFYNKIKLVIAGRDREHLLEPFVWDSINGHCKDEKYSNMHISKMRWDLGCQYGDLYPMPKQPEGSVNFTTADRPTFYLELQNIMYSSVLQQRVSQMKAITIGWAVYEFKDGRGRMVFAN